MPSLFTQRFEDVARPRIRERCGFAVTLYRGSQSTANVTAMWGKPESQTFDAEGMATDYDSREWTIAKTAYTFAGIAREPRAGDRIVDADGTWQVLPDDAGPAVVSSGDDWVVKTKSVSNG